MGFAGAVMWFTFALVTATGPDNSLALTLRDGALYGILAAGFVLLATTSVRLDAGRLVLVRWLTTTPIPLGSISRASGDDGLEIVTRDGVTYTHIGYGSSLIGSFTGNRRSTRVAAAVTAAVEQAGPSASGVRSSGGGPRLGLCWFIAFPAAFALIAGLVHG